MFAVANEAGRVDHAILILPFKVYGQPWAWALAAWLCLAMTVGLIFLTARRVHGVSLREAFWISALTATAPLYQARFALSVLPYAVSALCFTASLFLLSTHLFRPALAWRIGALVLIILACSTSSFLTLCWIPPALIAWDAFAKNSDGGKNSILRSIRVIFSYPEFIFLPVISFFARRWLFPAHGLYATYYQFKVSPMAALGETLSTLRSQIAGLNPIAGVFQPHWNLGAVVETMVPAGWILLLGYAVLRNFKFEPALERARQPFFIRLTLLILGLLTPILALYPYVVVQQPPRFAGLWETRHQLTLMLASGSVLVCLVRSVAGRRTLDVIGTILLFLFLTLDYGAGRQFLVDRLEQQELERKLVSDPLPPQSLVLIIEADQNFRMFGRFFAFYELTHMVNKIDGREDRLAVSNRELLDPATGTYAVDVNAGVVEKMLQLCSLRTRAEFGFAKFSYDGNVVRELIDPQVQYVSLAKAVELTLSGQPTNWISLERRSLKVDSSLCAGRQPS